jgi:hypothetical protein
MCDYASPSPAGMTAACTVIAEVKKKHAVINFAKPFMLSRKLTVFVGKSKQLQQTF